MEPNSSFPFRILTIIVVMTCAGVFILFNYDESESPFSGLEQQSEAEMSGSIDTGKRTEIGSQSTSIDSTSSAHTPTEPVIDITLEGSKDSSTEMASPMVWEAVQTIAANSDESTSWPKDQAYTELSINASQIRSLEAGAKIDLPIPDLSKSFPGNVAEKTAHENGDTSITGYIEGYDDEYPFILTVGGSKVFATIETPDGSYMIESNASSTRIISVAELERYRLQ